MTYCAHDKVYQNHPDVLLNKSYSFHVVKRLLLLAHDYSGQTPRKNELDLIWAVAPEESEISSYLVGQIDSSVNDNDDRFPR